MEQICYDSKNEKIGSMPNRYGHIEDTQVHLIREQLYVTIRKTGEVTVQDESLRELAAITTVPDTNNGKHEQVLFTVADGKLTFKLAIVDYIDHYPNCDGEYDRWSSKIVGYELLQFDLSSYSFSYIGKEF